MIKLLLASFLSLTSFYSLAAPSAMPIIDVGSEIQLTPEYSKNKIKGFKVISLSEDSIYKDLGYKKGDLIKEVNGQKVYNGLQLHSELDRQATEWDNTNFDNDFADDEVDAKSFEELEKSFQ